MIIHHKPFNRRVVHVQGLDYYCRDSDENKGHCSVSGFQDTCFACLQYQVGTSPPHYPVPALTEYVKFHRHGMISIQSWDGPGWVRAWWQDGHWGYETSGKVHYVD